jgi:ABC-type uncharacterized transport system auxiliary subunit
MRSCTRSLLGLLAAALTAAALAGCGLNKPYPDKNLYAIDAGGAAAAATTAPGTPGSMTVRLAPVRVAKPFDGQTFIYKLGPEQYRVDYYNGFVALPDRLIAGQVAQWLADSGTVKYAVLSGSGLECRYALETNVTALYGDYTQGTSPKAVVEVTFYLLSDVAGGTGLVMQKKYRREEPLKSDTPAELAAAYGRAWRAILTELTDDLGKAGK